MNEVEAHGFWYSEVCCWRLLAALCSMASASVNHQTTLQCMALSPSDDPGPPSRYVQVSQSAQSVVVLRQEDACRIVRVEQRTMAISTEPVCVGSERGDLAACATGQGAGVAMVRNPVPGRMKTLEAAIARFRGAFEVICNGRWAV